MGNFLFRLYFNLNIGRNYWSYWINYWSTGSLSGVVSPHASITLEFFTASCMCMFEMAMVAVMVDN